MPIEIGRIVNRMFVDVDLPCNTDAGDVFAIDVTGQILDDLPHDGGDVGGRLRPAYRVLLRCQYFELMIIF